MINGSHAFAAFLFLGIVFVFIDSFTDLPMRFNKYIPSFALFVSSVSSAQSNGLASGIDAQWHSPAKYWDTDLQKTVDADGTYGFIFNSSSTPAGVPYGSYNYCNMPHVRRQEYKVAPKEYQLEYVEVIHRHHKRTPYSSNLFPGETPPYDCSNTELFFYGGSDATHPEPGYWTPYWPSQNPWTTAAQGSNCRFPQLTEGGMSDSYQHGKDLFGVYHDLLHIMPNSPQDKRIKFRVTNNVITSQVAGNLIAGMYPLVAARDVPVSLLIENSDIDSLEPAYECDGASALYASYGVGSSDPAWTAHLAATQDLRTALNAISGVSADQSDWQQSWDHYFDNLSSRQCHGFPLPCRGNATGQAECVTQAQADEVYRLGQYEYAYLWRAAKQSLRMGVSAFGVWIAEFLGHLDAVTSGSSEVKYFHNVAHDGSMARLLAILQADVMVWPGMGSELVFEIYSKGRKRSGYGRGGSSQGGGQSQGQSATDWYVRILWGGQVFKSSNPALGEVEFIELSKLTDYLRGLVGNKASNVVTLCANS